MPYLNPDWFYLSDTGLPMLSWLLNGCSGGGGGGGSGGASLLCERSQDKSPWGQQLCSAFHSTHTPTHTRLFNGLFSGTTQVSRNQKGKTNLDLNVARNDGILGCSGISWTICKQPAPRSRQITTSTPHHSIFTGRMLFLTTNQQYHGIEGNSKHRSQTHKKQT